MVTGRFAQKPVPPWDDSTGTIRAKNRTGRFAQKTGTIRSKSNLEVDSPIFVIYIYKKCFALQMSMISISFYACECGKRFNTVPHIC